MLIEKSSSHTVGLELFFKSLVPNLLIWSPSHTVGLEQYSPSFSVRPAWLSPSHPVGLEPTFQMLSHWGCFSHHPTRWAWNKLKKGGEWHDRIFPVTIPHGGLRTMAKLVQRIITPQSPSHTVGLERLLAAW